LRLDPLPPASADALLQALLGHDYLARGDLEPAIRVLDQGLTLCRASGNRDWL
jgi:hypothetical protein